MQPGMGYQIGPQANTAKATSGMHRFGGFLNGLGTFSPSHGNQNLILTNPAMGSPLNVNL
jgi:hypothetical protein